MKKKIKICCVTGTRADYPRVKSVLREIQKNKIFIADNCHWVTFTKKPWIFI